MKSIHDQIIESVCDSDHYHTLLEQLGQHTNCCAYVSIAWCKYSSDYPDHVSNSNSQAHCNCNDIKHFDICIEVL